MDESAQERHLDSAETYVLAMEALITQHDDLQSLSQNALENIQFILLEYQRQLRAELAQLLRAE